MQAVDVVALAVADPLAVEFPVPSRALGPASDRARSYCSPSYAGRAFLPDDESLLRIPVESDILDDGSELTQLAR